MAHPFVSISSTYRFSRFDPTVARLPCRSARCIAKLCSETADMGDLISSIQRIVMPSRAGSFRVQAWLASVPMCALVGTLALAAALFPYVAGDSIRVVCTRRA